jgi:hypothetical protein
VRKKRSVFRKKRGKKRSMFRKKRGKKRSVFGKSAQKTLFPKKRCKKRSIFGKSAKKEGKIREKSGKIQYPPKTHLKIPLDIHISINDYQIYPQLHSSF